MIRLRDGGRARLSSRRGRCGSCQATHILLPSWMVPRRADAVGVIAAAAAASALHGTGTARIADLGVPAATVRRWLRRLRARADAMRQDAMTVHDRLTAGRDVPYRSRPARRWAKRCRPSPPARTPRSPSTAVRPPGGSPCWACSAWRASLHPRPAADPWTPARAPACPRPGRDAHHEHPVPSVHGTARDQLRAQTALDTALAELDHPWLGYVGDWHSHPAPCAASARDRVSIQRASRQYDQPLVLLIHCPEGAIETIAAHRGRKRETTGWALIMTGGSSHDRAAR